jgi:lipoprotein-releasing system ATP-binding protein
MNKIALSIKGLTRIYKTLAGDLEVLKGVDLDVYQGEIIGLIGPSGSGKSSLLHSAGLLEAAQGGQITIDGTQIPNDDKIMTAIRRSKIGFVYQFHNLLPEFDARENIAIAQLINGVSFVKALERAEYLLEILGLKDRMHHKPAQLSGGEQQRVAIGRALANSPKLILADEPTGNLDPKTSIIIFDMFAKLAKEEGVAMIVGTHNLELADKMDRVVRLEAGLLKKV